MLEGLFALIFIWMFFGCASQPMPSSQKSPPALATEAESEPTVKPNIPVLKKPMPSEQRPEFYVHKVRWTGETISVIAQWYTGNQNNWEHIVKVNSDLDPKRMKIGDKIIIPIALLKTRESMPRKYLGNSVRKKDASSSPRGKPVIESDKKEVVGAPVTDRQAVKSDEIELFQPQDIEQTVAESGEVELFQPVE